MKSTELMVYDWVSFDLFGGEITKITQVSGVYDTGEVFTDGERENIKSGCGCTYDANPIPITKEILELNGWKQCDFAHLMTLFVNEKFTCIEWGIFNKTLFINDGRIPKPIQYVHEIQHALRLCGLNKIADNFKLK